MKEKFTSVKVISFISTFFGLLLYTFNIGQDEITNKKGALVAKISLRWLMYGLVAKVILFIIMFVIYLIFFMPVPSEPIYPIFPY